MCEYSPFFLYCVHDNDIMQVTRSHLKLRKMHEKKEMKEVQTNTKRNHLQLSHFSVMQYPRELLKFHVFDPKPCNTKSWGFFLFP